jgi:hypothetical protein
MANPNVRLKRSAVAGKRPEISQLELGEVALNTNDGRLFTRKYNVGIGSTVTLLNPWTENIGGSIYYNDGKVGIGTTNPQKSIHIYTNDGDIKIGDITEGAAATDVGVIFTGLGTVTSAIFTEINGTLFSYGTNCAQITGIETGRIGGLFRLDTRTSGAYGDSNCFVLKGRSIGSTTEYNALVVGLNEGNTYLSPTKGDVLIGTSSSTGTANQRLQVTGSAYVSGNLGVGVSNPGSKLEVAGEIVARRNDNGFEGGQLTFTRAVDDASAYIIDVYGDTAANSRLRFVDAAGFERATLDRAGNFIIGAASSTGTANQRLQVTGGAYVSGAFGIGTTNPGYTLDVLTSIGGGARIGTANTFTVINPAFIEIGVGSSTSATLVDFHGVDDVYPDYAGRLLRASGANGNLTLVNRGTGALQIYAQDAGTIDFLINSATPKGRFDATGNLLINSTSPTGTASQPLQVSGGAYISENVGIGTTNPTSKIHIIGNSLVSGISSAIGGFNIGISSNGTLINSGPLTNINFVGVANTYSVSGTTVNITNAAYKTILIKRRFGIAAITTYGSYTIKSRTTTYTFNTSGTGVVVKLRTGISTAPYSTNSGTTVLYSENVVGGIASVTSLSVSGTSSVTDTRLNSVSEKSTLVSGNTVNLVYNTGSGNVAICTNPTGPITLNVTGIPTDSSFDNRVLTFSVIVIQGATGYACTTVNLNGVPETVRYPGGVISVGSTGSYDIFNFTGINTVGSASTAANYQVLGLVNGNFR